MSEKLGFETKNCSNFFQNIFKSHEPSREETIPQTWLSHEGSWNKASYLKRIKWLNICKRKKRFFHWIKLLIFF